MNVEKLAERIRAEFDEMPGLVLTLQQVMGLDVTSWGSWDKTSKTVPEILT